VSLAEYFQVEAATQSASTPRNTEGGSFKELHRNPLSPRLDVKAETEILKLKLNAPGTEVGTP
jgi:hypothetical protein